MSERFEIVEADRDGARILTLSGELDIASSPSLDALLRDLLKQHRQIELDLSALTFVDSTGLGVLVNAAETAGRKGGEFSITAASRNVLRVVELTGLGARLHLVSDLVEQAVDAS